MRTIGKLTTMALLGLTAVGAALAVQSIPDIKRYLRIREM